MSSWKEKTLDSYYSDQVSIKELICKKCNTKFTLKHIRETNWDGSHDSYDLIDKKCSCGQCEE